MERICRIAKGFQEAEDRDIKQQLEMTPEERLEAAAELKRRVYGVDAPDIRDAPGD